MTLIHEQIRHQKFGTGVVTEQTQTFVAVQFAEQYGTKRFLYPAAFDAHLTLSNAELQESVHNELRQIHEQEETERKRQDKDAESIRLELKSERTRANSKKFAAAKKSVAAKRTAATSKTSGKAKSPAADSEVQQ
jgi:hypothetical protein